MDEWACAECRKAQKGVEEEDLYCLCRQPYDETKLVTVSVTINKVMVMIIIEVFIKVL